MKTCPPAPGIEEVLIPGDMEIRIARKRRREGIPVDDATWRQIEDTARSVGCDLDATLHAEEAISASRKAE